MGPGSSEQPLRVAIVGSGPAGFYVVQHLFAESGLVAEVDMFDRLPAPFGLVRYGVAPDHAKIKSVTAVYHKLATRPGFRFFGQVELGRDLSVDDLRERYHQVVLASGAQTDRSLGIPGEDLPGSHAATEFVAWYNGHPDYVDCRFDLDVEHAVVIGVGNVAVDVARILCRTLDELARTDIADAALEALRESRVREVHLLGRRGPAQAAFTNPEVKELGELEGARAETLADEMRLDPLSLAELERAGDKATRRKLEILERYVGGAGAPAGPRSKRLVLRFLVSPTRLLAGPDGRVGEVELVRNELVAGEDGGIRPRATGRTERLPAGLVFRSVGYRGVALPGLPFDESRGVIPNERGRIRDGDGRTLVGLYVAGWIKRGPSGVIGTNKADAAETVAEMLADLAAGRHLTPARPAPDAIVDCLREREVRAVSYDDWIRLDAAEVARGAACGRPRVKLTRYDEFQEALAR